MPRNKYYRWMIYIVIALILLVIVGAIADGLDGGIERANSAEVAP